jgi:beta-galactosidase
MATACSSPEADAPAQAASEVEFVELLKDAAGTRLMVDGAPFMINGVNWDYYPIGTNYEYSLWSQPDEIIKEALDREMGLAKAMGANAIRQYVGVPPRWVEYIWRNYGIYTILNHAAGRYGVVVDGEFVSQTDYSDLRVQHQLVGEIVDMVREFEDVPGVLMWLLGNENNYGLVWSSAETEAIPAEERDRARARWLYKALGLAVEAVKQIDDRRPVAIANGDLQYLDIIGEEIPGLDIFGANVYRGPSFQGAFAEVEKKLGLPVLFTEFGLDAFDAKEQVENQLSQSRALLSNWHEIYSEAAGMGGVGNAIGGLTFQWSDGWWKHLQDRNLDVHDTNASWPNQAYLDDFVPGANNMNEEWFGIVAKGPTDPKDQFVLIPRAAYYTLQQVHRYNPYGAAATQESLDTLVREIDSVADVQRASGK